MQVPAIKASKQPEEIEERALHDQADRLLKNDMRRRFGKVAGDRAYAQIKAARYAATPAPKQLSRSQRKRLRRKQHNAERTAAEIRDNLDAWLMRRPS